MKRLFFTFFIFFIIQSAVSAATCVVHEDDAGITYTGTWWVSTSLGAVASRGRYSVGSFTVANKSKPFLGDAKNFIPGTMNVKNCLQGQHNSYQRVSISFIDSNSLSAKRTKTLDVTVQYRNSQGSVVDTIVNIDTAPYQLTERREIEVGVFDEVISVVIPNNPNDSGFVVVDDITFQEVESEKKLIHDSLTVGDIKYSLNRVQPVGWIVADGKNSIGSVESGATFSSNNLFELYKAMYLQYPELEVSGGRGTDAESDFQLGKTLLLPNLAARVPLSAGRGLTNEQNMLGTNFIAGSFGGFETHTLKVEELASHTHTLGAAHNSGGGLQRNVSYSAHTSADTHLKNTRNAGSNEPHNNMPPYFVFHSFVWAGFNIEL